jgi:peptide/nickel transport system substrate-binding protein
MVAAVASAMFVTAAGVSAHAASSSKSATADTCTAARVGGTVTFGQFSIPTSVDPAFRISGGGGGTSILSALYDTLLRFNGKTGQVTPYLAASFSHNSAFTQYTVKLRPGVKFGDGNPLDAAAVAGAQTRYLSTGNAFSGFAAYVSSIVAVDPLTVQYNLSTPWAELVTQLTQGFGMIADPAAVTKYGTTFGSTVNSGAGAGPYDLATFSPPSNVVLKAKSSYWQGPVCIQQINSTTAASTQQALDSFNTGQYQIAYLRDPTLFKQYTATKPAVGHYDSSLNVGAVNVYINTQSKTAHLDDVRVRQALQDANDVKTINQRAFGGNLIASSALVPKELGVVAPTKGAPYDPAAATKLLNTVKTETGWDGSIRLLCSNNNTDMGIALSAVLTNVGFKVNLDTSLAVTPFTLKVQVQHDFDIACGGFQSFGGDLWFSFYKSVFSPNSYSQFHDPTFLAAMDQLAATPIGTPANDAAAKKAQALQTQLVPQLMVGSFPEATLMQNSVHGMVFTIQEIPLWGKAYLSTK